MTLITKGMGVVKKILTKKLSTSQAHKVSIAKDKAIKKIKSGKNFFIKKGFRLGRRKKIL